LFCVYASIFRLNLALRNHFISDKSVALVCVCVLLIFLSSINCVLYSTHLGIVRVIQQQQQMTKTSTSEKSVVTLVVGGKKKVVPTSPTKPKPSTSSSSSRTNQARTSTIIPSRSSSSSSSTVASRIKPPIETKKSPLDAKREKEIQELSQSIALVLSKSQTSFATHPKQITLLKKLYYNTSKHEFYSNPVSSCSTRRIESGKDEDSSDESDDDPRPAYKRRKSDDSSTESIAHSKKFRKGWWFGYLLNNQTTTWSYS